MTAYLLITTLDVAGRQNNREHHAILRMKRDYSPVVVVYRSRRQRADQGGLFGVTETVHHEDGVIYVGVDPRLNPKDGAVRGLVHTTGQPSLARRAVGTLIDTAGIMRDWMTINALCHAAAQHLPGPDVLCQAFGPWAASAADRLRRQGLIKTYAYVDRDYEPGFMYSAPRRAWARWIERRAAARADLTLSIGQRLAARLKDVEGANVILSPTGVDADQFRPRFREKPTGDLIFVGEVAPWSGIEEVLDALVLGQQAGLQLSLDVFGPSIEAYAAGLKNRVEKSGLGAVVRLHGQRPRTEVIAAIDRAGIGLATFRLHPLRIHAAPLKLLEYMASGLPALAAAGSEAGDMVLRTGTGLASETSGPAIARAIQTMLSDAAAYNAMSRAGPCVAQTHTWPLIFDREVELLEQTAGIKPLAPANLRTAFSRSGHLQ